MTHTHYTKEILNIKDNNIFFYENCLETRKDGNIEIKVFHGFLLISLNLALIVDSLTMVLMIL